MQINTKQIDQIRQQTKYVAPCDSVKQRTNGPVNAHLISGHIQNLDKMAEKTLTLITNNSQLTHCSVYNINLIPGHPSLPLDFFHKKPKLKNLTLS